MSHLFSRTALAAGLALSCCVSAQEQQPQVVVPEVELSLPSSPLKTELPRMGGIFGELSCDRNGSIYFRPQRNDPNAPTSITSAVVRINSDGTVNKFSANDANGTVAPHVMADSVDADGRVYLLTMRPGPGDRLTVLQLAADSSYLSKTDLDRELDPTLFIALPSGDFLVGGSIKEDKQQAPGSKPAQNTKSVLWLFGNDGAFKREFLSTGDQAPSTTKTAKSKKSAAETPKSFTSAQVGDDGNIYVLEPGSTPRVFVFNDQGEKQRTLKLQPPTQGNADRRLYISNGRLMIPYWTMTVAENGKRIGKRVYRVYDSQSGIPMVDYVATFHGVLACMDSNDLLFLVTSPEGSLGISRVSMR